MQAEASHSLSKS